MHNVFWLPEAFWHLEGFAEDVFGTLREKNSDGITWYHSAYPFFPFQKISETQEVSPTRFFARLGQKNSTGKTWCPSSFPHFFSTLEGYWKNEECPLVFFGTVRRKNFDIIVTPLISKSFSISEHFWKNTRVPPTKLFGTVRQKDSDGKSWYPPIRHHFSSY